MNKKKIMFVLLAGLVLGACSKDSDELIAQQPQEQQAQEEQQQPVKFYPLSIEVAENPMVTDGEEDSNATRAAITTGTTLSGFNMNYVYGDADPGSLTAEKTTEGQWTNSSGWPGGAVDGNPTVYWYASTSGTFNRTDDANKLPYINFSTDEQSNKQHDLLIATTSGTWTGTGGNLSFTFDHVCSALRLSVKKSTNINDYTLTVTNIVLKNIVKVGKYYYNTSSWTLSSEASDRSDYTLYSGSGMTLNSGSTDYVSLNGSFGTNEAPYLFLIPQALTAWNASTNTTGTYISLTCTITKDASPIHTGEARIPFSKEFVKGKSYDVKINIGKNSLLNTEGNKIIN